MPVAVSVLLLAGCTLGPRPADDPGTGASPDTAPVEVKILDGVVPALHRDGRLFTGGQPDRPALVELAALGVATVVNLRTPQEMSDTTKVRYDEAAFVDSLGLRYVTIPLGGKEYPYTPAAVDSFAAVLGAGRELVFLHCLSGSRAGNLYAAYLARVRGWPLESAWDRGMAMGMTPLPFAQMLGADLVPAAR
ncbi:MAG: sulfur transferase domain-containing protein [bacterium]|nr:sulfur transferase domain-containing protein [bacterium]